MVTGLELIPIFLEIGPKAFNIIMKLKPKKGTSDFEHKLNSVKSILEEMEPLIKGMKQVEGTSTTGPGPGVPEDLKQLIQTMEEGHQLVREKKCKKLEKLLEEWIDSFWISLSIAMFKVLMGMASNVEQIKHQLLRNHESPQIQLHLHFSEEKYKKEFQKFINCINMFRGSETLPQGVESVSTDKTKDAKELKQSVPSLAVTYKAETSTSKVVDHKVNIMHSKKPEDNKVVVKKVVFEVLARDDYGKRIVEKAGCEVKGVISAERVVQDNQPKDLVIVIGTENFAEQDMIEYLKKKLRRKHVNVKEK